MLENSTILSFYDNRLTDDQAQEALEEGCPLNKKLTDVCIHVVSQPLKANDPLVLRARRIWQEFFRRRGASEKPGCFHFDTFLHI